LAYFAWYFTEKVLSGSVNEGRHYLSRAVAQWELSEGPRGDRGAEYLEGSSGSGAPAWGSQDAGGEVYSWCVASLLARAFSSYAALA